MTLLGFLFFFFWVLGGTSGDDATALLELLKGMKARGGCVGLTWRSGAVAPRACPSTFCGVSCRGSAVVGLDLSGQGLEGSIRANSVGRLRMLASLDFSNNLLSGELPEDLGNLSNLQRLDLSRNQLTGFIPSSLSGLHSLLYLNLSSNSLNGSIPSDLSHLNALMSLDLHNNQLGGEIDPALLALSSLTTIDLSSNKLSGFIPWQPNDTLPLLRTVEHVNLSNNQLTGPLAPAKFSSVFAEKLKVLDMSDNQLSGNLPDFEFVIALVTLRLRNNFFTGAVPPTLLSATLSLLEELDLSNNNLTGEVTRILSSSLKVLNISFNSLSGTLPQKLGSCSVVDLSHNNLNGDLSLLQYWTDMLEVLDLSFNRLTDRTGQRYAPLSWQQRLVIAVDIARGLLYLHDERHLPHGNLKATNVLIDGPSFSGRLADYSLHQLMTCEGTANQILNAGALGYRAPELATMKKAKPSLKGDIYAFGVLMLELLTGQGAGDIISGQSGAVDLTDWVRLLASEVRTFDCFDPVLVGGGRGHELPTGIEEMLALALKCISQQPTERPTIHSVYEELAAICV